MGSSPVSCINAFVHIKFTEVGKVFEHKYVTAIKGETFVVFARDCEEALHKAKLLWEEKHSRQSK